MEGLDILSDVFKPFYYRHESCVMNKSESWQVRDLNQYLCDLTTESGVAVALRKLKN
jgi:hypothetical protein